MGTCGNDYCLDADVSYILLGAASSGSTVPTTTQICNAIQAAETLINGHLRKATSYTTVPAAITAITVKIVLNIIQVQKWWSVTEGAIADSDYMGTASYPDNMIDKIMTPEIKEELDEYMRRMKYYEDGEVNLIIATPQKSDLDFTQDEYP